jgi:Uri superfamily endonuclease
VIESIPSNPGTYLLQLSLVHPATVEIGKLGCFKFHKGCYYYVGSAFGPGGLRARLKHHLRGASRLHWHVDYLRKQADIQAIWLSQDTHHLEHQWATTIENLIQGPVFVMGFGASDCACKTHLFYSSDVQNEKEITRYLQKVSSHVIRYSV